jgi:hypothetical protein
MKLKVPLQNAVTATDHQIDQLVYELYGLSPEEIALVEGAVQIPGRATLPSGPNFPFIAPR